MMFIGFCAASAKGSDPLAVYEVARDMAKSRASAHLEFRSAGNLSWQERECDIIVADCMESVGACRFKPAKGCLVVKTPSPPWKLQDHEPGFKIAFMSGAAEMKTVGDRDGHRILIGSPRLDLLCATDNEKKALKMVFLRSRNLDPNAKTVLLIISRPNARLVQHVAESTSKRGMNLLVSGPEDYVNLGHHVSQEPFSADVDVAPMLIASDVALVDDFKFSVPWLPLRKPYAFCGTGAHKRGVRGVRSRKQLDGFLDNVDSEPVPRDETVKYYFEYTDGQSAERLLRHVVKIRGES